MAEPRYIDANEIDFSLLATAHLDDGCVYVNDVRNLIDEQPTADVREVVHAKWIDGFCEKCGYDSGIEAVSGDMNYCPSCGAKMDKED